jgi:hypothetical protein
MGFPTAACQKKPDARTDGLKTGCCRRSRPDSGQGLRRLGREKQGQAFTLPLAFPNLQIFSWLDSSIVAFAVGDDSPSKNLTSARRAERRNGFVSIVV